MNDALSSAYRPPQGPPRGLRSRFAAATIAVASMICAAQGCSPFFAAVNAGSTPGEEPDRDWIVNALMLGASAIPTRSVYLTSGVFDGQKDGDFGFFDGDGIDEADQFCNMDAARPSGRGSFAALLSDGLSRVATTSPNCQDNCVGQIDWPLLRYTDYILPDGSLLFSTGTHPIFVFGQLSGAATDITSSVHWTGMNYDWTPAANCQQWITNGAFFGQAGRSAAFNTSWLEVFEQSCGTGARFICVER